MLGIKCNCGKTIRPGFQISKNKVKLVGTQSNINLSSTGNSMTNLHNNNSEMGKYSISNSNVANAQPYVSNNMNYNMTQVSRE